MASRTLAPARRPRVRDLAPRASPRQDRAKRTVEHILRVAGTLLEEGGLGAFNTNLLAVRAGVRVRTVYRYFPNKHAVIVALAQRMTGEWATWFGEFAAVADPGRDWGTVWHDLIARFSEGVRALPGGAAVRRAMHASPELRAIDQEDNARLARQLARALRKRGAPLSPRRAEVAARNLIETAVAVIDLALLDGGTAAPMHLAELARMHVSYLERLLPDGNGTRSGTGH